MKIGIIAAMASEREQLARLVKGMRTEQHGLFEYTVGRLGGNTLYIMECGIGKVNAAVGASELMAHMQPDVVVSTGVAGGIDEKAGVMEVVAASEVVYHDVWCGNGNEVGQIQDMPARFVCDGRLLSVAVSLDASVPVHAGLICTGDKFITERAEFDAIKAEFPEGLAVDMESAAIAQVCHLYRVPFISFRIISDTPGADAHWQQYENFWETMADRSFGVVRTFLEGLPSSLS
ncbi:5'-methylthioadenosine/adenosylhomocysteine nucleosidase [Paraprevotella xylaniphila]|uniref:5'-methylthioadenosine/adenosylhomocysteine nucleosidase n=1 Tax=Paraprevotella xylaniphila TaxID=454155 RepID=UPI001032A460|nr:5'-methylthioadenosine/adenosylhomocysteine nucleosidase [Paraprevotella xylaniphila]